MVARSGAPDRLGYLDGLRGWAALVVCFFHSSWQMFGTHLKLARLDWLGFINNGFVAVFVFFILSGVVLSQPFLRSGEVRRLQRMAIARYPRLMIPVAASLLLAVLMARAGFEFTAAAGAIVGRDNGMDGNFLQLHAGLLQWLKMALYSAFFYSEQIGHFYPVLWTMPIEIAGSFVLFGGLALFGATRRTRMIAALVGLVLSWLSVPTLSGFMLGAMIGEYIAATSQGGRPRWGNAAGLLLLAVGFYMATRHHGPPSARLFTPIALPIVLAVVASPWLQRRLEGRLSHFLGRVSFPLYLTHMLVLVGPGSWAIVRLHAAGLALGSIALLLVPALLAGSLLLAWLFLPVEAFAVAASHRIARALLP